MNISDVSGGVIDRICFSVRYDHERTRYNGSSITECRFLNISYWKTTWLDSSWLFVFFKQTWIVPLLYIIQMSSLINSSHQTFLFWFLAIVSKFALFKCIGTFQISDFSRLQYLFSDFTGGDSNHRQCWCFNRLEDGKPTLYYSRIILAKVTFSLYCVC